MKARTINNALHRYLGYFFFGMTIVYAFSGLALNHIHDWDPSYIVLPTEISIDTEENLTTLDEAGVRSVFGHLMGKYDYKSHYYPDRTTVKIFTKAGSITVNTSTSKGVLERVIRKPFFFGVNFLHYNPIKYWTYFADLYCIGLIILAITGLVVRKGKNGLSGTGGWLTLCGALIPFIYIAFIVDFSNY